MLDSEITAPLDSTPASVVHPPAWRLPLCMALLPAWRLLLCMAPPSAWRLPLYKAPSSMARALCKAPSSLALAICKAPSLTSALRLPICKAPSPRHVRGSSSFPHGAPCVHQLPKVAISSPSGVSKETWLSLISPLEMPDDARRASRSAQRRRSFPSSSTCKFSFLLYFQSTGFRPGLQSSKLQPRANRTTAHDETSRARRHEGWTAPYQSTARRLHRLARTADMWPCSLPLGDFSTLVIGTCPSSLLPKWTFYRLRQK